MAQSFKEFLESKGEIGKQILDESNWIQKAFGQAEKKGTTGMCSGDKFGGPTCKPGTKRYNMAKTLKKMRKKKKK
jgi:hypothetical protein